MKPICVQTEGGVAASAGTHLEAGTYPDANGNEQSYSACIDFSVNQLATRLCDGAQVPMNAARIYWMLEHFAEFGFCAWYRTPDEGFSASHIHIVCAMVPIKLPIVQHQVLDFVTGRNGLKSHATEAFYTPSSDYDSAIAQAFIDANPNALPAYLAALKAVAG